MMKRRWARDNALNSPTPLLLGWCLQAAFTRKTGFWRGELPGRCRSGELTRTPPLRAGRNRGRLRCGGSILWSRCNRCRELPSSPDSRLHLTPGNLADFFFFKEGRCLRWPACLPCPPAFNLRTFLKKMAAQDGSQLQARALFCVRLGQAMARGTHATRFGF